MSQLTLFAPEPKRVPAHCTGMPPTVERMWERGQSADVEQEVMAIFHAKPTEWLRWHDFREVIRKHEIGGCFGHILYGMKMRGLIEDKAVYLGRGIGAEMPGSANYQGYKSMYMLSPGAQTK